MVALIIPLLHELKNGTGVFSNVATWRNTYGADVVSLLRKYQTSNENSCGWAWIMQNVNSSFASRAFNVVQEGTAGGRFCSDYTLAHEVGHNMGCVHDRDNTSIPGAYDYSYGYDVAGVFGTIMSYDRPTVSYFSNPNVLYSGYPMGVPEGQPDSADNAKSIRNTIATVAQFRASSPTPTTGTPSSIIVPSSDSDGNYQVSWGTSSTSGVVYVLEEATNSGFTSGVRTENLGSSTSANITGRSNGVTYYYRVKATKSGYNDSAWRTGSNGCTVTIPPTLAGLTINGPNSINESSTASYTATADWSNGTTSIVTSTWSENSPHASINSNGKLTTSSVTSNQTVTVSASYTSGGVTKTASKSVTIVSGPKSCPESISPVSKFFGPGDGTDQINVLALDDCNWTASSSDPSWLIITSGNNGTGDGTVNYSVSANTGSSRTGTITIAGKTFTVTQDGGPIGDNPMSGIHLTCK